MPHFSKSVDLKAPKEGELSAEANEKHTVQGITEGSRDMSPRKVKKCDIMSFSVGLISAEIQRLKKIQDLGASHDREVREVYGGVHLPGNQ